MPGGVQLLDHRLELDDLTAAAARGAVGRVRGEVAEGVVAPVVGQAAAQQVRLADEVVHRQQLDGGHARATAGARRTPGGRGRRRCRAGAAGTSGCARRRTLDVHLVDDGVRPRGAQRPVAVPRERVVDDDAARHVRGGVLVVAGTAVHRVAGVAEQRRVQGERRRRRPGCRGRAAAWPGCAGGRPAGRRGRAPGSRSAGRGRRRPAGRARPGGSSPRAGAGARCRRRRTGRGPPPAPRPTTGRSSCPCRPSGRRAGRGNRAGPRRRAVRVLRAHMGDPAKSRPRGCARAATRVGWMGGVSSTAAPGAVVGMTGVDVVRGENHLLRGVDWNVEADHRWVVLGPERGGEDDAAAAGRRADAPHPRRGAAARRDPRRGRRLRAAARGSG